MSILNVLVVTAGLIENTGGVIFCEPGFILISPVGVSDKFSGSLERPFRGILTPRFISLGC